MTIQVSATHKRRVRRLLNRMGVKIEGRELAGHHVAYAVKTKRTGEALTAAIQAKWNIKVRTVAA